MSRGTPPPSDHWRALLVPWLFLLAWLLLCVVGGLAYNLLVPLPVAGVTTAGAERTVQISTTRFLVQLGLECLGVLALFVYLVWRLWWVPRRGR